MGLGDNQILLGFVVGMIEGEGEINVIKKSGKGKNKDKDTYHARITVANTAKELLDKIVESIGLGCINLQSDKRGNHKTCYRLDITRVDDCYFILTNIKPYLVSERKKKLCNVVIEFCETRIKNRNKSYTKNEIELHAMAKALNRKGEY